MTLLRVFEVRCDSDGCTNRATFDAVRPEGWVLARRGYVRRPWRDFCEECSKVRA